MAKYTGVTQGKDGSWSYRIKKKVNGQVVDTRIKKDENGLPFLTARAAHEAKLKHEAKLASGDIEIVRKFCGFPDDPRIKKSRTRRSCS